jgi:hypothetical protein
MRHRKQPLYTILDRKMYLASIKLLGEVGSFVSMIDFFWMTTVDEILAKE